MSDPVDIKYEALQVADVDAYASGDIAVVILHTDQGRLALHMRRDLLAHLGDEITSALSREA